ncbi:MAG TPA: helix-turn-helix transcriptional regulator [Blastocatellia bacterium]|nr:helix-turn-helix transcriptional regulator [Blastocatellia bacterium]
MSLNEEKPALGRARIRKISLVIVNRVRENPTADSRVRLIEKLVQEQYPDSRLTLKELARQANISIWHLARVFKSHTGASIKQYLRAVRMTKAKELLLTTTLSIKEVAAAVGHNHVSDFDHHFKATFQMRPGEFRRVRGKNPQ